MKCASVLAAAVLSLVASAANADDYSVGSIQVGNPWARATPRGSNIAGAYMTLTNKGSTPDRLVSGSTPVAKRFEVHSMTMDNGVAKMRPVDGGLELAPGATVELKPGSFHVMLIGLSQPLLEHQRVKGTLVFEHAGKVDVEFAVQPIGQGAPSSAGADSHSGH